MSTDPCLGMSVCVRACVWVRVYILQFTEAYMSEWLTALFCIF